MIVVKNVPMRNIELVRRMWFQKAFIFVAARAPEKLIPVTLPVTVGPYASIVNQNTLDWGGGNWQNGHS